ncbi:MAG: M20/M25/M40 family metallo-hydrolase [Chromatiales bacterium]|nr:M20/M25/M40 family metallo-hydrolase [Chromatiales bacterium]
MATRFPVVAAAAFWALAIPGLVTAQAAATSPEWPAYRLTATIDPPAHRLTTAAEITLPAAMAGRTVEFVLGANFQVTASKPKVEKLPADASAKAFAGINGTSEELANRRGVAGYRVQLPAGSRSFRVEYTGLVDIPPTASPEEYARSFAETPGIVSVEGIYLAGSTLWYPQLAGDQAGQLVTYSFTVNAPTGWHIIAPGNGVSTGPDGMARWETPSAVDEISIAGGPLTPYTASAGLAEAQVYLRKPDPALASKYLDATSRYLRMYNELIGAYPYKKFALVENFWETGYGMPSYTLLGPQIIRFPFILTSSYPHEILHNWWGNSVYVDYLTGNWCEGLTAYLADHLMKEIEGQGAEYRRDVLKKYRDFASTSGDFPLKEFRSRHSAATEAVGYGKVLMGFHELRQMVGDDLFRQSLRTFYKDYRGTRASFADVRTAFEKTTGRNLARFFDDWVNRTGAANLAVSDVKVAGKGGSYTVTGVVTQRQAGPYDIEVPVVVSTAAGPVISKVRSQAATTSFSIETQAAPTAVSVDPAFDVFRILDPRETAPSIGQLFGASEVVAVLPTDSAAETERWRNMLAAWKSPSNKITVVTDKEIGKLPADKSVWLLGRQNRFAAKLYASEPSLGLTVSATGVKIGSSELPFAGHSHVLTHRHPDDPKLAVGWVTSDPAEALDGLARKLPHYGKYSWLAFAGTEPANVAKGEWSTADSPLNVNLQKKGMPLALSALPKRAALAEPPAAYSADKLLAHVNWLAAPERQGRGFGSAGLAASRDYIRDQFAAAGLKPGGDNGTFFQNFKAVGGADNREETVQNVVAVLPGADPKFRGEAALLTAHYDHLGLGWPGARVDGLGKVHPGADDNASGVAVLIEMAKALAAGPPPPRTIVFVAFSAEEAGLIGSRHYVKNPVPVPLSGIYGVINLDTVGRLGTNPVSVIATESAREWPFVFSGITAVTGVPTKSIPGASESSDQRAFIEAGIPGVQLFAGAGFDYHRPTDTADKVDGAGMVKVATVATEAINYLASTEKRLSATAATPLTGTGPAPGTQTRRVSVGAVPDFAYPGPGLRIDGAVPGSPADKAGMKAGDILTHLNGKEVSNLGGFNEILKTLEPGQKVELRWTSAGAAKKATVELVAR